MYHHRKLTFPNEGAKKAPDPDLDIDQCDKFLSYDPLKTNLIGQMNFLGYILVKKCEDTKQRSIAKEFILGGNKTHGKSFPW